MHRLGNTKATKEGVNTTVQIGKVVEKGLIKKEEGERLKAGHCSHN